MSERGSALLLAVFLLAVLTGLGLALHFQAQMEILMSAADGHSKQTFYLAEAGVEGGRQALFNTNGDGPFGDDLIAAAGGDGNINFDPTAIEPVYAGDGTVTGFTGYGDDVPLIDVTALGSRWYAAFLTNDPGNAGGVTSTTDDNDRVLITGVGADSLGALRVIEAIVEPSSVFPGDIPALVTMFGTSPTWQEGTDPADVKKMSGDDCDGAGIPSFAVPVVGLITTPVEAVVEGALSAETLHTSAGNTDHFTVVDLTDPTDPGIVASSLGTISPGWDSCQGFLQMVDEIKTVADVICTPPTLCTLPPSAPDRVVFVDGDFTLSSSESGAGLLWVTGRLTMAGDASWNGILVVAGEGEFVRSGVGNGTVSGATILADLAGPDDTWDTGDDCSTGFRPALFDEVVGGDRLTTYCNADVLAATPITKYRVVGFRQR